MIIDFHVHSSASDGTFAPSDLVAKASDRRFAAIALTDHDNCDGVREFLESASSSSLRKIPAIELSIDPGETFHRFHLLGLGIDPENSTLKAFLKKILDGRNARNKRILGNFAKLGIEIAEDDIASYAHGDVLARPHFGRWLMNHGYVKTIKEAFDKYLADDAPKATSCYEDRFHPDQEEAFSVIHGAGGLCVMAHPKYWRSYWKETAPEYDDAEKGLAELREKGLDGLETLYQANTQGENVEFTRIANKLGLLKSAGSDFHGANKPTIPLGMEVSESFIAPLLERL